MNKFSFVFVSVMLVCVSFYGCKNEQEQAIEAIQVPFNLTRFEKTFFHTPSIELGNLLPVWERESPVFFNDYFHNILGVPYKKDSLLKFAQAFQTSYKQVAIYADSLYPNFDTEKIAIRQAFQRIQYYFPKYKLPTKLITYIGPWDAIFLLNDQSVNNGVFKDDSIVGIGLQFALGKDFPLYQEDFFKAIYPDFISRRFTPNYIPITVVKLIIEDLYTPSSARKNFIQQIIEVGKKQYLLDQFLPKVADSLKFGYTQQQWDICARNEKKIWAFFVQNDLVYAADFSVIKEYLNEGPYTSAFGKESPGFIGKFLGYRIVGRYMQSNKSISLDSLLKIPAETIFNNAQYSP